MKDKGEKEIILSKMKEIFFKAYMPEDDFRKAICFMTKGFKLLETCPLTFEWILRTTYIES